MTSRNDSKKRGKSHSTSRQNGSLASHSSAMKVGPSGIQVLPRNIERIGISSIETEEEEEEDSKNVATKLGLKCRTFLKSTATHVSNPSHGSKTNSKKVPSVRSTTWTKPLSTKPLSTKPLSTKPDDYKLSKTKHVPCRKNATGQQQSTQLVQAKGLTDSTQLSNAISRATKWTSSKLDPELSNLLENALSPSLPATAKILHDVRSEGSLALNLENSELVIPKQPLSLSKFKMLPDLLPRIQSEVLVYTVRSGCDRGGCKNAGNCTLDRPPFDTYGLDKTGNCGSCGTRSRGCPIDHGQEAVLAKNRYGQKRCSRECGTETDMFEKTVPRHHKRHCDKETAQNDESTYKIVIREGSLDRMPDGQPHRRNSKGRSRKRGRNGTTVLVTHRGTDPSSHNLTSSPYRQNNRMDNGNHAPVQHREGRTGKTTGTNTRARRYKFEVDGPSGRRYNVDMAIGTNDDGYDSDEDQGATLMAEKRGRPMASHRGNRDYQNHAEAGERRHGNRRRSVEVEWEMNQKRGQRKLSVGVETTSDFYDDNGQQTDRREYRDAGTELDRGSNAGTETETILMSDKGSESRPNSKKSRSRRNSNLPPESRFRVIRCIEPCPNPCVNMNPCGNQCPAVCPPMSPQIVPGIQQPISMICQSAISDPMGRRTQGMPLPPPHPVFTISCNPRVKQ